VSDLKATLGRAEELGGRALVPLAEPANDFGRFAVLADPDGKRSGCGRDVSQEDGGSGSGLVPGAERAIDGGAAGAGRALAAGHAAPGRGRSPTGDQSGCGDRPRPGRRVRRPLTERSM
jgi:hypothetical protein